VFCKCDLGASLSILIGRQFVDLKNGDRYYYENPAPINPNPFTSQQLTAIKSQTLARLVCNNFDLTSDIVPQILRVADDK
jgi:peroxidase